MTKVKEKNFECELRDCGFSVKQATEYLELVESGEIEERIAVLKRRRNEALTAIHIASKQIDCIDFCLYELEKYRKETL